MSKMRVTWGGTEVQGPARYLAMAAGFAAGLVGVLIVGFVTMVVIPLSLPLHFILRVLGRRGFIRREETSISYNIDLDGFKHA